MSLDTTAAQHLPDLAAFPARCRLTATVAAAGFLLVRKRLPGLMRAELSEVARIAVGVLAAIYGIILGFVIVSRYASFQAATGNVQPGPS